MTAAGDRATSTAPDPDDDPDASTTTTSLDLTNEHLHSLEGVDLPETLETVDLTANRLKELDRRLLALPNLRRLSLRQNLLSDASPVSGLASSSVLEELVLHDNELSSIPDLSSFPKLRRLELSYNEIRSLAPLSCGSSPSGGPGDSLEELYVAANKVTRIESLEKFKRIEVLELGSNRLRAVEGVGHLGPTLRELWLGRNRIESSGPSLFKGLAPLTRLERLSLQSNRLASMRDLPPMPCLRELYLSHNGIRKLENLSGFPKLKVLDVCSNALEDVSDLASGSGELTDLWLNDNEIGGSGSGEKDDGDGDAAPTTVDAAVLRHLRASGSDKTVTCLYLARNPVSVDAPAGLVSRRPVAATSALRRSDGSDLTSEEEEGQRKRAARAAFVRELAAALPALEELDGDDLPSGARV